jgi:hypothetical protein
MVLLSLHGLTAAQIAALLDCPLAMIRRFDREGLAGLADRPRVRVAPAGRVTNRTCGMPLGTRRRFGSKVCYRTQIWSSNGP